MYATKGVNIWAGRSTRGVIKIGACFQNTCCSDNPPPPVGPTGNICAYSQDTTLPNDLVCVAPN